MFEYQWNCAKMDTILPSRWITKGHNWRPLFSRNYLPYWLIRGSVNGPLLFLLCTSYLSVTSGISAILFAVSVKLASPRSQSNQLLSLHSSAWTRAGERALSITLITPRAHVRTHVTMRDVQAVGVRALGGREVRPFAVRRYRCNGPSLVVTFW